MSSGCGISCWHPDWLRKFANTRWFMIIYGLLGTIQATSYLYFTVTLSTIEKRFKIPSQTTGIILSGNEISQILLSLILTYFGGQRNRPRWIAWGVVFSALSCFILASPHFIYGAGEDAFSYSEEYLSLNQSISSDIFTNVSVPLKKNSKLCQDSSNPSENCDEIFSYLPLILIFLSQFILGIGNTLYYSLGQSYLDDNTHQKNTPIMFAYALSMRMFGPIIGFALAYFTMSIYIDPALTPLIKKDDPRWLGAWWLGWILIGTLMLLFASLIGMFPKNLPKKVKKIDSKKNNEKSIYKVVQLEDIEDTKENPKLKDFPIALMRLLRNKLLMYNIVSSIFYIFGSNGFLTFLSRVMEVQFNRSSAGGSILTGPLTILGMVIGFLISGYIITKYRPSPKYLFFWNVIVGTISMSGSISFSYLGCEASNSLSINGTFKSCNSNCFCDDISYTPVCNRLTSETFFSPCHAGCKEFDAKQNIYTNCTCSIENNFDFTTTTTPSVITAFRSNDSIYEFEKIVDKILESNEIRPMNERKITLYDVYDDELKMDKNSHDHDETIDANDLYDESYDDSQEKLLTHDNDDDDENNSETILRKRRESISFQTISPGACENDCNFAYYTFSFIALIVNLFSSTGRIGNILVNFRCIEPRDKSFAQGLALFLVSLFALIPAPIIFGRIIDSTCLSWNFKCGDRGNCQLYDPVLFRYYLHTASAGFIFVGVIFDVLVWHFGKNLDLYGEKNNENEKNTEASSECQPLNK